MGEKRKGNGPSRSVHRSTDAESAKLRREREKVLSRGMHAQLQRVIKVPLSTIICAAFLRPFDLTEKRRGKREIKMPLYAAICPCVSTSRWHYPFFPARKTTRITSSSRAARETVSHF